MLMPDVIQITKNTLTQFVNAYEFKTISDDCQPSLCGWQTKFAQGTTEIGKLILNNGAKLTRMLGTSKRAILLEKVRFFCI